MLYNNITNLNLSKDTKIFRFNLKNLTYVSNDTEVKGDFYIPVSTDELNNIINEYKEWCEKFSQPVNETLITDISNIETYKEKTLENLKNLSDSFRNQLINKNMFITSSLGFVADADKDSQDNAQGLIELLTLQPEGTVEYRDRDNVSHDLNLDQLKTLLLEMKMNGAGLFKQKWALEDLIPKAENLDDLNAIKIEFNMMDFSQSKSNK